MIEIKSPYTSFRSLYQQVRSDLESLGQRPCLFLAQTSLAVKKTTRASGGDLISLKSVCHAAT